MTDRPPLFDRLDPGPPCDTDDDWWVVPVGAGVTHRCADCATGHVDELLEVGAYTVAPDEAGYEVNDARGRGFVVATCEVCGGRP